MTRHPVPYRATGRFAPIVTDYVEGAPALREFFIHPPDMEGLHAAMAARSFDPTMRAVLGQVLEDQYAGVDVPIAVRTNLDALTREGTLTVTTGHQLCLFTGPLYVPFKILNVIRLAREISTAVRAVVPVFWMATEDHDREEIRFVWINGKKVIWSGDGGGPAGRAPLTGIDEVVREAEALLGAGPNADELRDLLRACYREEHTLAQATRLFINALFGRYGIVVIDGDDARLKRAFAPIIQEELLNEVTSRTVQYANEKLEGHYALQAHARDINLFHLRPGHRSRIVREDDRYRVLDGGPEFTLDQLLVELELHPEYFSPNVLMRPLYQETVLPNIAYVGGGGELAYWLQLRWLFQGLRVPIPALVLRTSAALLSAKDLARWKEFGLDATDLFSSADAINARVASSLASFSTDLGEERSRLQAVFDALGERVRQTDPTLEGTVRSGAQKAMKGIDHIEEKLVRAAKQQQEVALHRVKGIFERAFPDGGLQERRDNFMPWYAAQGPDFFDELLLHLYPLDPRFSVLAG